MIRHSPVSSVHCPVRDGCPAISVCAPFGQPLCETFEGRHRAKLSVCERLEAIADSLPHKVDRLACLAVAADLLPAVRKAQAFEESVIFPVFSGTAERAETLRRLLAEHVEDEAAAEELTETLLAIGHGHEIDNPEALGFMLRAFFEAVRRHVAFEREHVMPMVVAARLPH